MQRIRLNYESINEPDSPPQQSSPPPPSSSPRTTSQTTPSDHRAPAERQANAQPTNEPDSHEEIELPAGLYDLSDAAKAELNQFQTTWHAAFSQELVRE